MAHIAIFTVLISICAWISIPAAIPFTLQTFGIFMTVCILGGHKGTIAILLYILMGLIGLPVFTGFRGGPGVLFSNTGGYIIGFIFTSLIIWAFEKITQKRFLLQILSMLLGLLICYAFGTFWFMQIYTQNSGTVGLNTILTWCVLPFVIPDCIKLALAYVISKRLRRFIST